MNVYAIVALAGLLAAIGFFLSARAAKAALAVRVAEEDKLRAGLDDARKAAGEARAEAKEWREEASGLKADLEKSKRKAFEQQESAKRLGGAQGLREELDKVAARLAEARAEAEHQGARARGLEKDLERSQAELARAKARAQEQAAAPAPAPAPAAPPPGEAEAKLAAEKDRADKAEGKLAETKKKLADVEKELKAARGRLETERRVFVVQKGELELAHDRYAELKRRHDGLRKDHDELVEAVRQAAREERRLAEGAGKAPGEGKEPAGGPTAA
jgi:DNA repair exonuclease SbcCD ATPase subunit